MVVPAKVAAFLRKDGCKIVTICYIFNAPGAYMTKLTPPHQTPPGASKNGSQRVSLGTFGQSQNGDSKLQGGRLSKLSSVVNTDFGRMKGTNRRIFLLKKILVCVLGVLK